MPEEQVSKKEIKEYDFRQGEEISKAQTDALKAICDSFFQKISNILSNQFGIPVQSRLISAEEKAYSEFIQSLKSPTIMGIIDMNPLLGMSLIELDPNLVFNFIDRLLGGQGETIVLSRGLTDIEYKLVEGIFIRFMDALKSAWASIVKLEPNLVRIENNPQFIGIAGVTDRVIVGVAELRIGETTNSISYCIPLLTVESIMDRLSGQTWMGPIKKASAEDMLKIKELVNTLDLFLIVELGRSEISLKDILHLQVGDVLRLNNKATDELIVRVNELPRFKGLPGLSGMNMAVQISRLYE